MITVTTDNDCSIEELREGLIDLAREEREEYEDGGWADKTDAQIEYIVDRYLNEATDEEVDNFFDEDVYEDRDETILCYLNEWCVDNGLI
jgi:hypothetical protein